MGPVQEDEKKWIYSVFAGVYREVIEMGIEENPARYEKDYDGRKEYVSRLAQMCSDMFFGVVWRMGLYKRDKSDFVRTVGKIKGNNS